MLSILDVLPPEIVAEVFLNLDDRELALCQSVCKGFDIYALKYRPRRVVFSWRGDAIVTLRELIASEHLRKIVTELVYDASRYSKYAARDWDCYRDECTDRRKDGETPPWERTSDDGAGPPWKCTSDDDGVSILTDSEEENVDERHWHEQDRDIDKDLSDEH